jgi:shikimate kinase
VVLVGPRGAGKSTVGPLLAGRLRLPFVDVDARIVGETGRPIADLLRDGTFRAVEARCLAEVLRGPRAVVAAGGGAVLWAGFREAARGWRVVWLDADPRVLARRVAADPSPRPSLLGRRPEDEIADLTRERRPLYEAASWRRVATDDLEPGTICARIEELLWSERQRGAGSSD